MLKRLPWVWAFALSLTLLSADVVAKKKPLWRFRILQGEEVKGRMEFGVVRREGTIYVVSAFYAGLEATGKRKKEKPVRRAYAELAEPGILGKYKRWDIRNKVERYWMTFTFKGMVKVRYEKGPGAKGEVKELGEGTAVAPLDGGQPQFAYLLAAAGESGREVACVGVSPPVWGKATVVFSGPEKVTLKDDIEETRKTSRWDVIGDCGKFKVYLDEFKQALLITTEGERYERFATDLQ